ncbi:hypothetical protein K443DRAFT_96765 [Laccaria amethystina LaAM-08-1]|uniref:SCP domain-containing protein n=1 Tax=Laccaria amethystina LaAM-08-1 TaxID=1095629 RepID=A0A0C9XC74_9AGAR|nr:hypothetical protein K443DRAFT_96765 [Laccaria amethystina LaAM-08-1]
MQLLSLISVCLTLAISTSALQHRSGKKHIHKIAVANHRNDSTPAASTPTSAQTTPYAGPTPAAVYQSGSTGFVADVLTQHNDARAKYGASPLIWSAALYPDTQAYANKCVFQHSGGDYAENLYVGGPLSVESYPIMDAVNDWMSEAYNNPQFTEDNGHFINIVFKSNTQVACAVAVCAAGTIYPDVESQNVVCRYNGDNGEGIGYVAIAPSHKETLQHSGLGLWAFVERPF